MLNKEVGMEEGGTSTTKEYERRDINGKERKERGWWLWNGSMGALMSMMFVDGALKGKRQNSELIRMGRGQRYYG